MSEPDEVQKRIESIEGLIREIDRISDPAVRSLSRQIVQSLMDLHGAGLRRMLEIVHESGGLGQQIIDRIGESEPARSLLLLYGLHPLDMETRVLEALEKTRPYLRSHGGNVELLRISETGAVVLRLEGSCHSCPSSTATLQSTIEQAIYDAAPDVTAIVVEGTAQDASASFLPLSALQGKNNGNHRSGSNDGIYDPPEGTQHKEMEEAPRSAT